MSYSIIAHAASSSAGEKMKSELGFSPGSTSRYAASRQLALVHITNLHDLMAVYGMAFYQSAVSFIKTQLEALGSAQPVICMAGAYVFIDPEACRDVHFYSQDRFCEHVNALLASGTVACAEGEALLRVETTFIDRSDKDVYLANAEELPNLESSVWAASTSKERSQKKESYKADMRLAVGLFAELSAGSLVLAFESFVSTKSENLLIDRKPLL
jgi:hypothetical protein